MAAQSPADVWKDFCHQLEQAGTDVLNWEASPMEQAEGLRYLSRLLRISLEMNLENADPAFPIFIRPLMRQLKSVPIILIIFI